MTLRTRQIIPEQVGGHAINPRRSPWSVVVPEATENHVINPSFEANVAGWTTLDDATVSFGVITTDSYIGGSCMQYVISGGTFGVITYSEIAAPYVAAITGETWTASCYIKYPPGAPFNQVGRIVIVFLNSGPTVIQSTANLDFRRIGVVNEWIRISATATAPASTQYVGLSISTYPAASGTLNYFIDAVQLEKKAYPTTYVDGEQDGCYWTGTPHASTSKRNGNDRRGGRVWNFRNFSFDVIDTIGAGAPLTNVIDTPFALIGGGYYQRSVYPIRQFAIAGAFSARSPIDMGRRRAEMWNALKPSLVSPQQPVRLLYSATDCDDASNDAIVIDAVYAGGLEGALANSEIDRAALAFRAHRAGLIGFSPSDTAQALDFQLVLSTADFFFKRNRTTGAFSDVTTPNNAVYAIVPAPQGGVYVGGAFSSPVSGVGHYDAATDTWTALGVGANNTVFALMVGADGSLYAGGVFSSIGGVAVQGFARWNGSAWAAVGGGVAGGSATVYAIAISPFNEIYIGGNFLTVNGVDAHNVAKYLTFWESLGGAAIYGTNGQVTSLAVAPDNSIYVGGEFTQVGSPTTTAYGIARWNGATWLQVGGTGLATAGQYISGMLLASDGRLFVTGAFAGGMAQAPGAANAAVWNGAWSSLGGGFNDPGYSISLLPDGNLMFAGEFLNDGSPERVVDYGAVLIGNAWVNPDWMPDMPAMRAFAFDDDYEYIGGQNFTIARTGMSTAVNNVNSATVYPRIVIIGSGQLICIKNITTGDNLYFNLELATGERAVLTLGERPSFTSNLRANLLDTILAPSNLATWKLQPGVNYIYVYMLGDPTSVTIIYRRGYESLDQVM